MGDRVVGKRLARGASACAVAIVCAAAAGAAPAATLKVHVTPAAIHKGDDYTITVSGTYKAREVSGRPYLISLIQFSADPCKASAQQENDQVASKLLQFYFAPASAPQRVGVFLSKSPFSQKDAFTAKTASTRRVCAYLYPKFIHPTDTTAPIARASAKYTVLKKK